MTHPQRTTKKAFSLLSNFSDYAPIVTFEMPNMLLSV